MTIFTARLTSVERSERIYYFVMNALIAIITHLSLYFRHVLERLKAVLRLAVLVIQLAHVKF